MAETKTLYTRIKNKMGSATQWQSSTLKLLPGELAIMPIESPNAESTTVGYMIKVGNNDTFSAAKGLVAYAADVHAWAKAANKPSYTSTEITRSNNKTVEEAIAGLEAAVGGSGSVGDMIRAAIEALDVPDEEGAARDDKKFVCLASQADGKISVSRRVIGETDIKDAVKNLKVEDLVNVNAKFDSIDALLGTTNNEGTVYAQLTSLRSGLSTANANIKTNSDDIDALEGVVGDTTTGLVKDVDDLQALTSTQSQSISTANNKISAIEAALAGFLTENAVKTKFEAIEGSIGTLTSGLNAANAAITTEKTNREDADTLLSNRIGTLEDKITGVAGAMHFVGISTTDPSTGSATVEGVTKFVKGDVVIFKEADDRDAEFVYDGTTWVELGDVTAEAARIAAVENVLGKYTGKDSVETAINAVSANFAAADETLQDNIDKVAGNLTTLSNTVTANENANSTAHTQLTQAIADGDTAVKNIIGGYDSANTVKKAIDAVSTVANRADTASSANATDISTINSKIGGSYDSTNTVKKAIDAAQAAAEAAQKDVDDLEKAVGTAEDAAGVASVYGKMNQHMADAEAKYATKTALKTVSDGLGDVVAHYVYSDGTNLKTAADEVIIFDCGGV